MCRSWCCTTRVRLAPYISGLSSFSGGSPGDEPYLEQSSIVATAMDEALATDYDGTLRIAPAWPSGWNASGTVYIQGGSKVDVQVEGVITTAAIQAGTTETMTVRNPWSGQQAEVVNGSTGAVVVAATTSATHSVPVTAGSSYLIEQPSSLTTSLPFAQVTGTQATAAKHLGNVQIEAVRAPPGGAGAPSQGFPDDCRRGSGVGCAGEQDRQRGRLPVPGGHAVSEREGVLPWPDERIWVRLRPEWTPDPDLRWSIEGSAQTHRGHLHVSARDGSLLATVHPGDITDASPEAWLWIDGFLRGQEAGLFEFLGHSLDLLDNHDDGDIARWLAWNQRFRRHGWAPPLWPVPATDPVLSELTGRQPWAYSAGRFWVWQDGTWVVADPQPQDPDPDIPGQSWPGTRCVQRGHHLLASLGAISACEDCHLIC